MSKHFWIIEEVHKLIYTTQQTTIDKYLNLLALDDKGLKRVNSLRKLVENLAECLLSQVKWMD